MKLSKMFKFPKARKSKLKPFTVDKRTRVGKGFGWMNPRTGKKK